MFNKNIYKKGVSLLTVLVFMMVATVATTATYKWLSTVGFTSADRMAIASAKEASHAGIENARSWMTYHANDVGAIVRQYYDGGKKPVALTNLVRGANTSGLAYTVWLTGVQAAGSSYKFTVVSTGSAQTRTDTKYSETAVFNVTGLYKVKVPVNLKKKPLDFGYSYFGGSTDATDGIRNSSMLVNGNWKGNPARIDSDFVVTGNATLSGSEMTLGKHSCIGGDLNLDNQALKSAQDLFVAGRVKEMAGNIFGNAYFSKSLHMGQAGQGLVVNGDMTVMSRIHLHGEKPTTIKGNFCLGPDGNINNYHVIRNNSKFNAQKNVKILNKKTAWWDNPAIATTKDSPWEQDFNPNSWDQRMNLILGGSGYSIYFPNANTCANNNFMGCVWNHPEWMVWTQDKFFSSYATLKPEPTPEMDCETNIVDYCENVLGSEGAGCDGSKYKIDDALTTAYDVFSKLAGKVACADVSPSGMDFDFKELNNCYNRVKDNPSMTYHGYLVVKIKGGNNTIFRNPKGTLDGNFIFFDDDNPGNMKLPVTTESSNVFFYLARGAGEINTTNDAGKHNYFVYSKESIGALQNNSYPEKEWNGTFFLSSENCARIEKMVSSNQYIKFNANLMQNLLDSMVICSIDEKGSCGETSANNPLNGNGNTAGENLVEGYDSYYVAVAPILSVSLESQRRNKEVVYDNNLAADKYTTVQPSIVVLPRVIFLSDAPAGKLKDYYNVVNLNGATEQFAERNTSCAPDLETSDVLFSGVKLSSPLYKCFYTPSNGTLNSVPFWVVVDTEAESASKSEVSFTEADVHLLGGGKTVVQVVVSQAQGSPVSARIKMSAVPSGWNVQPRVGVTLVETNEEGDSFYDVSVTPGSTTSLFDVEAEHDAENDMVIFSIESLSDNARYGLHPYQSVWVNGAATILREDIPAVGFCDDGAHKSIDGVACSDIVSRPDCEGNLLSGASGAWIVPNCKEFTTQSENEKWSCGLSNDGRVKFMKSSVSPYCDVFVHDSSIAQLSDGKTYTLYASYKAKLFKYKLTLDGAQKSNVVVRYSKNEIRPETVSYADSVKCDSRDTCRFSIPAGYHVDLVANEVGGEEFHQWQFPSSKNANGFEGSQSNPHKFMASSDSLIVADFTEHENHCFYSDFKDTEIWCERNNGSDDCIDKCSATSKQTFCVVDEGGLRASSDWIVPRTNDGHNYNKPEKDGDSFLFYSSPKSSDNGNSTITYVMNRTKAGGHGTLMARFKTCPLAGKNNNLNSGFIIRSNETTGEYANLQVYGVENGGSFTMTARLCKGDGSGIKNVNQGNCESKAFSMNVSSEEFSSTVFNVDVNVAGDEAVVELSYKKNQGWERAVVKLDMPIPGSRSQYVGLSLAEDCFKVTNIGWESTDWGSDSCFNVPKVGCSFAANYLGGILPVNEDVQPWVGTSSWFNDPTDPYKLREGCTMSYHYNGCDLYNPYSTHTCQTWIDGSTHCGSCRVDSEGPYYVSGVNADLLDGDRFNFSYVGLHGISKEYLYNGESIYGSVRDASVVVDCSGYGGNGQVYNASCGRFMVGNITECSQNVSFKTTSCEGRNTCVVSVAGGSANLRSSNLIGEISGLPENEDNPATISVIMTDLSGLTSQEFVIGGNGRFSRDVSLMADMQEFDPEKVASIVFVSEHNFTLTNLSSSCPNSVGVPSCEAFFDGDRIVVSSTITNSSLAKCSVEGSDKSYGVAEKDCPNDGLFYISASDLQKKVNESGDKSRELTFTVTATSKDNYRSYETCTTAPLTINSNEFTLCELSATTASAGESLPSMNYAISNCPESGCLVDASIGTGTSAKISYTGNGQVRSWSPDINTTAGTYRYTLSYAGLTCTGDVTVAGASSTGGKASNCAINTDKKEFTADLDLSKAGAETKISLLYMDAIMGTEIKKTSDRIYHKPDKKYTHSVDLTVPGSYKVALLMGGTPACIVDYEIVENKPETEISCRIENGRFVSDAVNTGETKRIILNRNKDTNNASWGNDIATGEWPKGGKIDLEVYLPDDPGRYTFNLWTSKRVCYVTVEVKDPEAEK